MDRIFNFSAGPATMPTAVLEKAQKELLNFDQSGMSIMEMSHRSKAFEDVLARAKSGIISLLNVPDNYDVLFIACSNNKIFKTIMRIMFHNMVYYWLTTYFYHGFGNLSG